jgi:autophagy-related protein 2
MFGGAFSGLFSGWEPLSAYTSLSTGLQKRIASFLLKRAIGHLVKDGQLDLNQIEAGVTAGRLEIRDIELDTKVSKLRYRGILR